MNKVSSEQLKERTGCSRASEGMDRQSQLKRQLDRQADEKCAKIKTTGTLRISTVVIQSFTILQYMYLIGLGTWSSALSSPDVPG